MKALRGFTTVEVVVALALLLGVGGLIIRGFQTSSSSQRAAEATQNGTGLLKTVVDLASREAQPWLPEAGRTTSLSPDQIRDLLARTPEASYTDPRLYEVQVSRQNNTLEVQVCVRPTGERYCFTQGDLYIASSARRAEPRPAAPSIPPVQVGTGHLTLTLLAPGNGPTDVTLSGSSTNERYSAPGIYDRNLLPGTYTLRARTSTDSQYSYDPHLPEARVEITAGRTVTQTIEYTCSTGAVRVDTYYPEGYSPAPGTVQLTPGNRDLSRGGLIPYLLPGSYSLSAQEIRYNGYTYRPTVTSSTLPVRPCTTPRASVNYAAADGILVVNIGPNLSDLAGTALVAVSGPAGVRWASLGENTYNYLTPGSYSLNPQSPLVGGVRYQATGPASATVEPGQTKTVTLTYAPVSGRIRVEATAPEGLTPRFTLTGPNNYNANGSGGAENFDDLKPGDYTVSFDTLQGSIYTYGVPDSPLLVSLNPGERKTLRKNYIALTGALTVSVDGLPDPSLYTNVSVNDNPLAGNPYTYPYLTPGPYQIQARPFTYGGYTYTPDRASQSVDVSAGNTTTARVTYIRQSGTVTITVTGLPSGVAANATLTLPDGSSRGVEESQTLTGMPTGSYRLTASPVVSNGVTYQPSITPSPNQTLSNRGSITYTLTYTAVTGSLRVLIQGAPGQVDVTGPNYARTISGPSILLANLTPGTYRLTPRDIARSESTPYGNLIYTWSAPAQTVNVVAGPNPDRTISYTKQAGRLALSWNAPGGTGRLDITGPGGFNFSLSVSGQGGQNLIDIPTGTYTLTPRDYTASGITYGAASATVTVTNGTTTSTSLSWLPKTGRIVVTVIGMFSGVSPTVRLLSGNSLIATASGMNVAFNDLPPGAYRVEGDGFSSGGFGYSAAGVNANVTAGATTPTTLTYIKQSGFLRITSSGLPPGLSGSATLSPGGTLTLPGVYEVATGTYTLSITDVTDNSTGISYRGTLSLGSSRGRTLSLSVSTGSALDITATYSAQAATLTLNVTGLPNGATASYTVRGSRGGRTASGGNGIYPFYLPYGSYTVTAADALSGDYRYAASVNPSSVNLGSDGATVSVAYRAVSGALVVNLRLVPSDCTVTVTLSGPAGRSASRTGSGPLTFSDLPPGSYTVRATECSNNAPDVPSKSALISAGTTSQVDFTYVRLARLNVYVEGLPLGTPIYIPISGPTPLQVTSTFQSFSVRPGDYSYAAQSLTTSGTLDGVVYRWNTPAGRISVSADTNLYIRFRGTGSIVLDISSPVGADVSLTGRRYTAPGRYILNDLSPGTYNLQAASVTSNGLTYNPTPSSTYLTVNPGSYAQIRVNYATGQARMIINITQNKNSGDWYGGPPGFTINWVGIYWGSGVANRTYTHTAVVQAGTWYTAGAYSGEGYEMAAYCSWFFCWRRDYWVVYYDGLPTTPTPGSTVTVNVWWVARRCEQIWFSWVCYDVY